LNGFNANEIVGEIQEKVIDRMEIPSGYIVKMGGEQEEQAETGIFLAGALGAAVLLIYLI
jgi:multidrug efflux pump subunit AcrB